MDDITKFENPIRFKPDYAWPSEDEEKNCPRCDNPLTLNENQQNYMGKPWWCGNCRWQFTVDEI